MIPVNLKHVNSRINLFLLFFNFLNSNLLAIKNNIMCNELELNIK